MSNGPYQPVDVMHNEVHMSRVEKLESTNWKPSDRHVRARIHTVDDAACHSANMAVFQSGSNKKRV